MKNGPLSRYMYRGVRCLALTRCGVPNLSTKRQHHVLVALGGAIREVRISKGISQEKLALLADIDRSYVGRVERGDNNAAVLTLARIASALGTTISKLMVRAGL